MLIFQNPTPNPTPIPALSPQIIDKIVDTSGQVYQAALDKQAFVVFMVFIVCLCVIGVLLALGWTFRQYASRNRPGNKEDTAIKGVSDALGMFGKLWERSQTEQFKDKQETAERDERRDKEFAAREAKWLEALEGIQRQNKEISQGFQAGIFKIAEITGEQTPLLRQLVEQTAGFDRMQMAVNSMSAEGSEPVKAIRTNTDHILKLATDILSAVQNLSAVQVTKEDFNTSITELKLTISALRGVVENAEKRKTDSQPVIAVDTTPTPQLGATS